MKKFCTSKVFLIVHFILVFVVVFFVSIVAIIFFGDKNAMPEDYFSLLKPQFVFCGAIISFAIAAYFSFYRKNLRVEISDEGVRIFRAGNEYLFFPAQEFIFSSYVVKNNYNGIPAGTTKFLRVIDKFSGKEKDYALQGFGKDGFEEIIALATELNERENNATEKISAPHEDLFEYDIDAEFLAKKIKRDIKPWFLPIGFALGAVYIRFSYGDSIVVVFSAFLFFAAIIVAAAIVLKSHSDAKLVPKKISVHADKICVDEKIFFFEKIDTIKITPPSYNEAKWEMLMLKRKLIISDGGKKFVFIVGAVSDRGVVAPLEDYEMFCEKLKLSCEKLMFDLV